MREAQLEPRVHAARRPVPRASAALRDGILLLLVPALGFVLYGSAGRDDAYITYEAADQLRQSGQILNINGDRLEQSTSLLHTVLLALLSWMSRVETPTVGFVFGIVCGALTVALAYQLGRLLDPRAGWPAALIVGTLGPFVYWSFGGLETSLAALCLVLVALAVVRMLPLAAPVRAGDLMVVAAAILAAVTVRPEYGLVLVVALGGSGVTLSWFSRYGPPEVRGRAASALLISAAFAAVFVVAVVGFRLAYFGSAFPRPVVMKASGDVLSTFGHAALHPLESTGYVRTTLWQSWTLVAAVVALGGVVAGWVAARASWVVVGAVALVGLAEVCVSGGDWMEAGRLAAPWIVLAGILAGAAIAQLDRPVWIVAVTALVVAANVVGNANYVRTTSLGTPMWNRDPRQLPAGATADPWHERWDAPHRNARQFLRDGGEAVVRATTQVSTTKPRLASVQGGEMPYYLRRDLGDSFEFVDQQGLTTTQLDGCRSDAKPTQAGKLVSLQRWLGHEQTCGPLPEIYVGILNLPNVATSQYQMIFAPWLTDPKHNGPMFVAVRRDLAPQVKGALRRDGWTCAASSACTPPS